MPIPRLTDEESKAVIAALKKLIVDDNSKSPLLDPFKSALAKLDAPALKAARRRASDRRERAGCSRGSSYG
jgi:hypothetical protein